MPNVPDSEFLSDFDSLLETVDEQAVTEETEDNEVKDEATDDVDSSVSSDSGSEEEDSEEQEQEVASDEDFDPTSGEPEEEDKELDTEAEDADESDEEAESDFENLYKELLAPFKANGRQIEVASAEEARQLMKMGANYTKKMQAIAQHKKAIMMLDRNGIDEDKLSYAIDLLNGESEAIKKFFADTKIDPLDIDVDSEVQYEGNRHAIQDNEVFFQEAIDEVLDSEGGGDTIREINEKWDKGSVAQLGSNPEVLKIIHAQKQSGVYDQVVSEIERRQALGLLSTSVPFLQAYDSIGNELISNGQIYLDDSNRPSTRPVAPIAKGTGKIKTAASNKAKAASITKSKVGSKSKNPLEDLLLLDDEKFLEAMKGRV